MQGWDAYIIAIWIGLCSIVSSYGYPLQSCVKDWLKLDCGFRLRRIVTNFSSRRSLLSTLVYLNPDSQEERTAWINPILAQGGDRIKWEKALLRYILTETIEEKSKDEYLWKFILEGVDIGRRIKTVIEDKTEKV